LNLPKHFPAIWPKPFPTTTPSTSQIPIPRWSSPGPGPGHKYYYCTLKASMWQCPCMCSPCIEYTTCNSAYLADRILPRFVPNQIHKANVIGHAIRTKMFFDRYGKAVESAFWGRT
jgi:hypothetical protein